MTEKKFRMETVDDMMLPFIVDNDTANKSGKITSYHTYETHRKDKCLELVDLLNELWEEKEQLKSKLFDCNLELEHSKESVDDAYWELTEIKKENEQLKKLIHIADGLIEWNTIPQVRREWGKQKKGDAND